MKLARKDFKVLPRPRLKRGQKWASGHLVTFPCSYRYNGGIVLDGKWYAGFSVPNPIVPKGYELVGIGIGAQLNCRPPMATMLLRKKKAPTQKTSAVGLDV